MDLIVLLQGGSTFKAGTRGIVLRVGPHQKLPEYGDVVWIKVEGLVNEKFVKLDQFDEYFEIVSSEKQREGMKVL